MLSRLRNARTLARLVLVWFALAMGVAIASPLVKPQSLALVCSGSGMLKVLDAGDGRDAGALRDPAGLSSCALCVTVGVPPSEPAGLPAAVAPAPGQPQPVLRAVPGHRAAAPLPARGPPLHA